MDMTTPMQPKPLVDVTCKLGEKGCFKDGRCHALGDCENKIVTNADRIRAMTDEELAEFLAPTFSCYGCPARLRCERDDAGTDCNELVADWLKQPYGGAE